MVAMAKKKVEHTADAPRPLPGPEEIYVRVGSAPPGRIVAWVDDPDGYFKEISFPVGSRMTLAEITRAFDPESHAWYRTAKEKES